MKIKRPVVLAAVGLFLSCMSFSAVHAKEETAKGTVEPKAVQSESARVAGAAKAIKEITSLPKRKIPPVLIKEAASIIIAPKATKNAFMVKNGSTGGILLTRDKSGAWGSPVFISLSGGTLGWQIVGDPMDIVLLFKSNKHIDALLKGKLTLDAKISIVSGRVSATMKGASKEELAAEITSYVRSHGAFVEEAVVAGTVLQVDTAANDSFYGKLKVNAADILSGTVTKSNEDISSLQSSLTGYSEAK